MLATYQQRQEIQERTPGGYLFATIGNVYEDGVSLTFETDVSTIVRGGKPGESGKHYKCNPAISWAQGMRAFIAPISNADGSGTYFVICPVGTPAGEEEISAKDARNVTETINGEPIAEIFDTDGKTVRKAKEAAFAKTAESAEKADAVDYADYADEAYRSAYVNNYYSGHTGGTLRFACDGRSLGVNVEGTFYWLSGMKR